MSETAKYLLENIDDLKALVVAKDKQILAREKLVTAKDQRIAQLEEQLQLLRHKRFGASSEKADADQLNLFNEAEASTDVPPDTGSETTVPEHKRKKRGRKSIDENLPRVIIEHDIPESEKICACGKQKHASARKHRNS